MFSGVLSIMGEGSSAEYPSDAPDEEWEYEYDQTLREVLVPDE